METGGMLDTMYRSKLPKKFSLYCKLSPSVETDRADKSTGVDRKTFFIGGFTGKLIRPYPKDRKAEIHCLFQRIIIMPSKPPSISPSDAGSGTVLCGCLQSSRSWS
jgi:hypothetical protein